MRAYHEETVDNVVTYIAKRYHEGTGKYIVQMLMYKILALLDFQCVKELGLPCTELSYRALEMGPVPDELYNNKTAGTKYIVRHEENFSGNITRLYIAIYDPDMGYISECEKAILDNILDEFISKSITAKQASQITHERIVAWRKTRETNPNGFIDYDDEFDNLAQKSEDEMTCAEREYTQYRMFTRV